MYYLKLTNQNNLQAHSATIFLQQIMNRHIKKEATKLKLPFIFVNRFIFSKVFFLFLGFAYITPLAT